MNERIIQGTMNRIDELEAQLTTCTAEREAARQELDKMRARAIVAEQHKVLSLLGKSSYQEVVEDKLRLELAEAQVLNDQLAAELVTLRASLTALAQEMRGAPIFMGPFGYVVTGEKMRELANQLDALTERPTAASSTNTVDPVDGRDHEPAPRAPESSSSGAILPPTEPT